jgi:hypothetical protein
VALVSCGGDGAEEKAAPPRGPTIARSVAAPLAVRSDNLAALLDRGDACGAQREAAALRADLTRAINARAIPDLYLEDLSATVNEIQAQLPPCVNRGEDEDDEDAARERRKGKDKGERKGKRKHGEAGGNDD